MSDHNPFGLAQNDMRLNRASHHWLMKARAPNKEPHHLYLLSLAAWGLENGAEGEWPVGDRHLLHMQVDGLFAWKADNVLSWLLSNPNGPETKEEQEANLLNVLHHANSPKMAAAVILNAIYSRQVSHNAALQPAASEWR